MRSHVGCDFSAWNGVVALSSAASSASAASGRASALGRSSFGGFSAFGIPSAFGRHDDNNNTNRVTYVFSYFFFPKSHLSPNIFYLETPRQSCRLLLSGQIHRARRLALFPSGSGRVGGQLVPVEIRRHHVLAVIELVESHSELGHVPRHVGDGVVVEFGVGYQVAVGACCHVFETDALFVVLVSGVGWFHRRGFLLVVFGLSFFWFIFYFDLSFFGGGFKSSKVDRTLTLFGNKKKQQRDIY